MNFEEYRQLTNQFAQYPKEKELEYLVFGLVSEYFEYKQADTIYTTEVNTDETEKEVLSELGDCFWYISQLCNFFSYSSYELRYEYLLNRYEVESESGDLYINNLVNSVKKYLRGDYSLDVLKEKLEEDLMCVYAWLIEEIESYASNLSYILQLNIEKLTDRQQRNVIKGDGDNR